MSTGASALPNLSNDIPELPSLSSVGQSISTAATSTAAAAKTASAAVGSAVTNATTGGLSSLFSGNNVVILIGVIIVAIGIYSFKNIRETVNTAVKTGAKAAA